MIHWKRYPGGIAKLTRSGSGAPYAKSEDGRFIIFVHRYLHGEPGHRAYSYHFSAVDYGTPSDGHRYSTIPIKGGGRSEYSSNVEKVKDSVEQWAIDHPKENPLDDSTVLLIGAGVVLLGAIGYFVYRQQGPNPLLTVAAG